MCRDSNQHVEAFLNGSNGIRAMWTPDSQYRVTQSAYNAAARSQTVIPLRPARFVFLTTNVGFRIETWLKYSNVLPSKVDKGRTHPAAHELRMACRFLKAGVSGGAERAQLVAEIEAKQGVGAPCACMLALPLLRLS